MNCLVALEHRGEACGRSAAPERATETHTRVERRQNDRRQAKRFVWRERRSGFDRRQQLPRNAAERVFADTLAQLRARPDLVILVILTINLLSAVDAVLTLNALSLGAQEANPLLRTLMERDPTLWIWAKTAMVAVLSFALWALRRYRMGLIAALFGLGAFTATLMWHIVGSIALFS